jgi:hypothetical protein
MALVCLAGVLVLGACGGKPAPLTPEQQYESGDVTTRDALRFMPASAHLALAVPSFDAVDAELTQRLQTAVEAGSALKTAITELAERWQLGEVSTFGQLMTAMGIDTAQPAAVFVLAGDGGLAAALGLKDAKVFEEKFTLLTGSKFAPVVLKTNWHSFLSRTNKAQWSDDPPWGYFIKDNRVFVASSQAVLVELVARQTTPAAIAYGLGDYPGKGQTEIVALARLGAGFEPYFADINKAGKYLKVLTSYFEKSCDEMNVTVSLGANPAYVRAAAHETTPGAAAELPPLASHRLFPSDTVALAALRMGGGLNDLLAGLGAKENGLGDAGRIASSANALISSVSRGEVTAGLLGMTDSQPTWLVLLPIKDPQIIKVPLSLAGAGVAAYNHQTVPVHKIEKKVPFPIYVGLDGLMVFVSNNEDALKQAIDRYLANPEAGGPAWVAQEVQDRGPYGFAVWNPEQVTTILGSLNLPGLPENLDFGANSFLALDSKNGWRQATLSLGNVDAVLQSVLPILMRK